MGRVLATDVHVIGPKGPFDFVVLEAGTELPDEYADQVTAESAFAPEPIAEEQSDTDASEEPTGYAAMSNKDLAAALEERDLPHTGNKADLIARLEADDAERAAGEGEESDENGSGEESPES